MSKNPRVGTPMDRQHVKRSETLLKSGWQYFGHISWSLLRKIRSKNTASVVSEILRLFVKKLTPDASILSQKQRLFNPTNSNTIISKSKNICWIFYCISGICVKFWILWKKRWTSEMICFWNYWLEKLGLLKCLKSSVSQHLWTVNSLKCPKDCLNLHGSIFVIFLHQFERKSARKFLI